MWTDGMARPARGPLIRWLLAYGTFSVPQAAGPIAFTLLAVPLTGDPRDGAALVLAITIAQVIGAVPVARLGHRANAVTFLKLLVAFRALALFAVGILAAFRAPFALLLVAAAVAGLVNGAAFGYLRSILNHLVAPSQLPRALGLAAALSEFTFVAAPVAAAQLGTIDPVLGLLALTALGTASVVLVPRLPDATVPRPAAGHPGLFSGPVLLWLGCTLANSAVVSSIEIGSVSLALRYGFAPSDAFVFTVALCVASVGGGIWVSARNRIPARATVLGYFLLMSLGAALVALDLSASATLVGAVIVGCALTPLATYYSLMLDALAPAHRKAEVFALSRTANSLGIILTSAILTLTSLTVAQIVCAVLISMATIIVGIVSRAERAARG